MAKSWQLNHSHAYMVLAVMGTWPQRRMIAIPMGSWVVVASWSGVALLGLQKSDTFSWGFFPGKWRTPPPETLGNVAHVHFRQHDEKLMKGGLKVYHDHFSCIFVYGPRIYLRRHGTEKTCRLVVRWTSPKPQNLRSSVPCPFLHRSPLRCVWPHPCVKSSSSLAPWLMPWWCEMIMNDWK